MFFASGRQDQKNRSTMDTQQNDSFCLFEATIARNATGSQIFWRPQVISVTSNLYRNATKSQKDKKESFCWVSQVVVTNECRRKNEWIESGNRKLGARRKSNTTTGTSGINAYLQISGAGLTVIFNRSKHRCRLIIFSTRAVLRGLATYIFPKIKTAVETSLG